MGGLSGSGPERPVGSIALASVAGSGQNRGMVDGDPMLIRCEGGATVWRTATFPPAGELPVADGIYVLVDEGPPEQWWYQFISEAV